MQPVIFTIIAVLACLIFLWISAKTKKTSPQSDVIDQTSSPSSQSLEIIKKQTTLTRFLDDPQIKKTINQFFENPIKRSDAKTVFPPTKNSGVDFGGVGTAYDYLVRCQILKSINADPYQATNFIGIKQFGKRKRPRKAVKYADNHMRTIYNYIACTDADDKQALYEACLFFAKFETEYRSGYPVETYDVRQQNISELDGIESASSYSWIDSSDIVLNPLFSASRTKLFIKADGDLIVGDRLVELKTSSRLQLKGVLRQLVGYYILNKYREHPYAISSLGIFYPRFNYFVSFPVREVISVENEQRLIEFFKNELGVPYRQELPNKIHV